MSFFESLALAILIFHLLSLTDIGRGLLKMIRLSEIAPDPPDPAPRVSIIVPACNEELTIKPALQTLLAQDYPNLEIIVVNDRSTDGTRALLEELQRECTTPFTLLNISDLPAGWLGKSHALQMGAEQATGDILLFTDADIEMEKTTLSRAVTLLESERRDHLCLIFQALGGNWLLDGMILDAASGLLALFRPWRAGDERSRYFMGVGAFNMVRTSAYFAVGGHRTIAMHPIDDILLGKILKEQGFRQLCVLGKPLVTVRWYPTAAAMITGLMKNVFSVVHYRLTLAVVGMLAIAVTALLPPVGLILATGTAQLLFGAVVCLRLAALAVGAKLSGMPFTAAVGGLLAPAISIYIIGRSAYATLKNGGITWRGSRYPLSDLRKSRPLFF